VKRAARLAVSQAAAWVAGAALVACAHVPGWEGATVSPDTNAAAVRATPTAMPCWPDPLGGRSLHLRGSFNQWEAADSTRFTWQCNRYVLVARLMGAHQFKVGDEAWSSDANFGVVGPSAPPAANDGVPKPTPPSITLAPKGQAIPFNFNGDHRFMLSAPMSNDQAPTLTISPCPVPSPPLGSTTVFLRGSMNATNPQDAYAFQWSCDAYYLNVDLQGAHSFKVADAAWTPNATFGATPGGRNTPAVDHTLPMARADEAAGATELQFTFGGAQTIKLDFDGAVPRITIGARSFADPNAKAVVDPIALQLRHDTRQLVHKAPFGAVAEGTTVSFALDAPVEVQGATLVIQQRHLEGNQEVLRYDDRARVAMRRDGARFVAQHRFDHKAIYGYWFEATVDGKPYVVQNNSDVVPWTREKGSNGSGQVGEAPSDRRAIRRFRLTVHDPRASVPDWAADAVYYYIFPERFRNGDPSNDPKAGVNRYQDHGVEVHARWNDKPYKPGTGDGSDAVYNNDFFGGDLAGVIQMLDYIRDLGANTIYMTPIFKAASNHKYDHADYHQIDPAFGDNALFTRLTHEASKRGIRIVLDASLNHTGSDSTYFDRYGNHNSRGAFEGGKRNPASPYASWYRFNDDQAANNAYEGWVGIADLPSLDKSAPAWRDFAYRAPDSVTRIWLQRGAGGWRMDVAPWVPDDFWREWRQVVKATKPDAITIAETWFDSSKYFLGDMFDSTMNYIFRSAVHDFAGGGDAAKAYRSLELMRELYPAPSFYALMNLLSTHDQPRSLHVFGDDGERSSPQAKALAKQRYRLALMFQTTYAGAPTVYYGDEVGVTGGEDPYNRQTYPWADTGGQPDMTMHAEVKRLLALRAQHAVLRRGQLLAPMHADRHTVVLARQLGAVWAVTGFNNAAQPQVVTVALPAGAPVTSYVNGLTGSTEGVTVDTAKRQMTLTLPPMGGVVALSAP
jgi:cyclomaltodextrinase / maltogenic alpha-amylase / neopullulanase